MPAPITMPYFESEPMDAPVEEAAIVEIAPAPHLDGRYTRFAHVVSGMDVAQRLVIGDAMSRVEQMP